MDNGTKCSLTNMVKILSNARWYNKKFKPLIQMKGATSDKEVVPEAEGKLRV